MRTAYGWITVILKAIPLGSYSALSLGVPGITPDHEDTRDTQIRKEMVAVGF